MKKHTLSWITAAMVATGAISLPAHAETPATDAKTPPAAMKVAPRAMAKHRMMRHSHCACPKGGAGMMGGMGMGMGPGMGMGMMGQGGGMGMGQGMMGGGMGMMGQGGMGPGGMGMGPGMMGGGMMGGMGMMRGMHHPMMHLNALKLSDEQRAKVNKLTDALRKQHWTAMGAIMDDSAKLRDLYAADKRDPAAIGQVYQHIFDQQRQMIEANVDTQNHIDDILTPEQRDQLKQLKRSGPACNCPSR